MRKALLPALAVVLCLLLASCATPNPYGEENPYVYVIGQKGSYVFSTTDSEVASNFADLGPLQYRRVTGCLDPVTGRMYGAIEGDFRKGYVNTGLSVSGQFDKIRGKGLTYWKHRESGIELAVPANGIILFATDGIAGVVESTFTNPVLNERTDLASRIISVDTGVYVEKPVVMPDVGLDLDGAATERFDYIMLLADTSKYDLDFGLTTENYASSFLTLLRAAYVAALKEAGEKVNVSALKDIVFSSGKNVYLKEQVFDKKIISSIMTEN